MPASKKTATSNDSDTSPGPDKSHVLDELPETPPKTPRPFSKVHSRDWKYAPYPDSIPEDAPDQASNMRPPPDFTEAKLFRLKSPRDFKKWFRTASNTLKNNNLHKLLDHKIPRPFQDDPNSQEWLENSRAIATWLLGHLDYIDPDSIEKSIIEQDATVKRRDAVNEYELADRVMKRIGEISMGDSTFTSAMKFRQYMKPSLQNGEGTAEYIIRQGHATAELMRENRHHTMICLFFSSVIRYREMSDIVFQLAAEIDKEIISDPWKEFTGVNFEEYYNKTIDYLRGFENDGTLSEVQTEEEDDNEEAGGAGCS